MFLNKNNFKFLFFYSTYFLIKINFKKTLTNIFIFKKKKIVKKKMYFLYFYIFFVFEAKK